MPYYGGESVRGGVRGCTGPDYVRWTPAMAATAAAVVAAPPVIDSPAIRRVERE